MEQAMKSFALNLKNTIITVIILILLRYRCGCFTHWWWLFYSPHLFFDGGDGGGSCTQCSCFVVIDVLNALVLL